MAERTRCPIVWFDKFGLDSGDPLLNDPISETRFTASAWNDSRGKSFKEIADMIEYTFDLKPKRRGKKAA
jgi:hypothetical protein